MKPTMKKRPQEAQRSLRDSRHCLQTRLSTCPVFRSLR